MKKMKKIYVGGRNRLENKLIRLVYSKYKKLINNSALIGKYKIIFRIHVS